MLKRIKDFINYSFDWNLLCVDEALRMRTHAFILFIAVTFITFIMSILNLVTHTDNLLVVTSSLCVIFAVLSVVTAACSEKTYLKEIHFVCVLIMAVSAYFIYNGGTQGFSPIWVCLFPLVGYMICPPKVGHIFNICLALMVCIGYLTPVYDYLAFEYTSAFRFRFPVVMIFGSLCSGLIEIVRFQTQKRLAVMTKSLKDSAYIDAVTGIANRKAFSDEIDSMLKGHATLSYAVVDVDHFKQVNDTYGHMAGDIVLNKLADILTKGIRPIDRVYRWGGEEFLILMSAIEHEAFAASLERLRKSVETHEFGVNDGMKINITISAGGVSECDASQMDGWVRMADECMYMAKQQGRNLVVTQHAAEASTMVLPVHA